MEKDFVTLVHPIDGFVFDTHTDVQNEFISRIEEFGIDFANEWLLPQKREKELSYPRKLRFSWTGDSNDYKFELSRTEDFIKSFAIISKENFCYIDNLEIGTKYFWRVNNSKPNCFYTLNNKFRFISIDGALNVRDLGGNKIKQGIIFRGSDIDTQYPISEEGKKVFKDQLDIKSEVELRLETNGNRPCVVGDSVKLVHLPYRPYKEIFDEDHIKGICKIMDFLSCSDNYPMYIHCLGGADRTGMIAMYLRAIAGEDDETILTDYELTSLSSYAYGLAEGVSATGIRSRNSDYFNEFLYMLNRRVKGDTLAEKLTNFLIFCGVKECTLEKIANIIKQ